MKNEETLREVRDALYDQIRKDRSNYDIVRKLVGEKEDLHYFLNRLLHNEGTRGVVIVIVEANHGAKSVAL
jgi:riboflavin synthase